MILKAQKNQKSSYQKISGSLGNYQKFGKILKRKVFFHHNSQKLLLHFLPKIPLKAQKKPRISKTFRKSGKLPEIR